MTAATASFRCILGHICIQRIIRALSNRLGSACARFGLIHGPLGDAMECQAQVGGYNTALWLADHHKTPSSLLHLCLWGFGRGGLQQRIRSTKMSPSDSSFKMILGSSSRSRRQILSEMGYDFIVVSADIDEKDIRRHTPEELVMVLAEAKADAIISKLRSSGFKEEDAEPTLLITADQVVVHGGMIREKPSSTEEAREFIKGYSAGHASTVGSVLVTNLKTGVRKGGCDKAEIYFHKIPDEVIDSLIEEGDVLYVAGGLMVEHPLTSPFVEAIVGTIDGVMGLPKALTQRLIHEALQ